MFQLFPLEPVFLIADPKALGNMEAVRIGAN